MVSPKHSWGHQKSFGVVIVASLHDGLTDIKMFLLHKAVCLGVVGQNLDMMNAILLREVTCGSHKGRPIVGHDFSNVSPSHQEI